MCLLSTFLRRRMLTTLRKGPKARAAEVSSLLAVPSGLRELGLGRAEHGEACKFELA